MKLFFSVIFLTIWSISQSQSIRFQLNVQYPCKEITTSNDLYSYFLECLSCKNDTDYIPNISSSIVLLPDTGTFRLHLDYLSLDEVPTIKITSDTMYTFQEPKIALRCYGDPGCFWEMCEKKADGYQEDYYANKRLKLRGNFSNGEIKDTLILFYQNGVIQKRYTRLPEWMIIQLFDSLSHRISIDRNSTKSFFLTDYEKKEFFPDGSIKKNESRINNILILEEFYGNGNLKTKQTKKTRMEYYIDGKIHVAFKWKLKRDRIEPREHQYNATVTRIEYDENGMLISKQAFEIWSFVRGKFQPGLNDLNIRNSDWIVFWEKFEGGNKIFEIKDIDPQEYFKLGAN